MIQHGESSGIRKTHQCSQTAETDIHQEEVIKSGGEKKIQGSTFSCNSIKESISTLERRSFHKTQLSVQYEDANIFEIGGK